MIMMDEPEHTRLRKIVSRGFTPRAVERLWAELGERAQRIAARSRRRRRATSFCRLRASSRCRRSRDCSGFRCGPRKAVRLDQQMIGDDDPEFAECDSLDSAGELMWYAMQLAARKTEDTRRGHRHHIGRRRRRWSAHRGRVRNVRRHPDHRGQRDEPQPITQGMMAFTDFPDQWQLFTAQRPRPPPTRSFVGPHRSRRFSAPRWPTPNCTGYGSRRVSDWCCSTGPRTSTRSSSTIRSAFNILRDPNPHSGIRRHRRALLRRRQPGEDDHRPDVQRDRRPSSRT